MGKQSESKSFSEEMYVISVGKTQAFDNKEGFILEPHPCDSPEHKCKCASITHDVFDCWKTRYLHEAERVKTWIRKETKLRGLSIKKIHIGIDLGDD